MEFIMMGAGVGCCMYAFVNHRWNDTPWIGSAPFFWAGLTAIFIGMALIITS